MGSIGEDNLIAAEHREEEEDPRYRLGGVSADEQESPAEDKPRNKRHRHSSHQTRALEAFFKQNPHPNGNVRHELGLQLGMTDSQVKFWFQNRRTQLKVQIERQEHEMLKRENKKLKEENLFLRETLQNPTCGTCNGPAIVVDPYSSKERMLLSENARLKAELNHASSLAGEFLNLPLPSVKQTPPNLSENLKLGLDAMDVLLKMAEMQQPLWLPAKEGKHVLNSEEYSRMFPRLIGLKPDGFVEVATRESAKMLFSTNFLVDALMDAKLWAEMFPCLIAGANTVEVVSSGFDGTKNGTLQLMHAELQVLSPLVPVQALNFLRYCKQLDTGGWAIVDISLIDNNSPARYRKLPSGCLLRGMPDGQTMVTWVDHVEYDETVAHPLYRPLVRSGLALGARRWLGALYCHYVYVNALSSPADLPAVDVTGLMTPAGKRSMLDLARRMRRAFNAGICLSSGSKWQPESAAGGREDMSMMTRVSVGELSGPQGVLLSVATSAWLPVPPLDLFAFLRDERVRTRWDILSPNPMQEMARIQIDRWGAGDVVLLLGPHSDKGITDSQLILQETCGDPTGPTIVYAAFDAGDMYAIMNGGDLEQLALLPSGFVILPDGTDESTAVAAVAGSSSKVAGGSLLTLAFQILLSGGSREMTTESVRTVTQLVSCTIERIRTGFNCEA